ncbi:hypothetical protein [Sorangium sp. So ce1024]|uniref:hypothetical protein n=1 Tax=Sorangium sp. So ce1024 TaxID=3133327 RepID=UPI003F0DA49F
MRRRPGSSSLQRRRDSVSTVSGSPGRGAALGLASCLALLGALLFTSGCGHPAGREECEAIFQRSAEIELRAQNIVDPKVVEERIAAVRDARKDLIDRCVGRRITDAAMACVRQATTPEQVDRCLE